MKGHSGHPWNEMADVLADAGALRPASGEPLHPALCRWIEAGLRSSEWAVFLRSLSAPLRAQLPAASSSGLVLVPPAPAASQDVSLDVRRSPVLPGFDRHPCQSRAPFGSRRRRQASQVVALMSSINVQTLGDTSAKQAARMGRTALLQQQYGELGYLLVGVQETRIRKSGITTGAYFDSLSSAATTAGQNGVSLWVARHIPVNPEAAVPVYLSAADTRVSHQTSRILIAHIRKARFDLHAVVLHAVNQAHASPEEIHAWWAEVRTAMHSSIPHGSGVVVFADVNGRVGSIVDQVVGPSRAQEEDLPGYLFRSLLAEWSLCLPCTYEHIASSHQPWLPEEDWHTWTSNAGGKHRIDFLAIPRAALNSVRRCYIPPGDRPSHLEHGSQAGRD